MAERRRACGGRAGEGVPAGEGVRLRPRLWRAAAPLPSPAASCTRQVPPLCPQHDCASHDLPPPPPSPSPQLRCRFIQVIHHLLSFLPSLGPEYSCPLLPPRMGRSVRASPSLGAASPFVPGAGGSPRCPAPSHSIPSHLIPSNPRRGSPPAPQAPSAPPVPGQRCPGGIVHLHAHAARQCACVCLCACVCKGFS